MFTVAERTITARHGELRVRDYLPAEVAISARPLVWVHGGGFAGGSIDMAESDAFAKALAETGRRVTTVDYHLVPRFSLIGRFKMKPSQNRYPVPAEDVVDAYLDAKDRHTDGPVLLGGASAGACLAATAALMLRDAGEDLPAALVLVYGLFHGQLPEVSEALRARLKGIARLPIGPEMVRRMTLNYVGSEALHADPSVFPGTADVHGLPATLLLDADRDVLRASGAAFGEHLRSAGVPAESIVLPDARHGFFNKPGKATFGTGMNALAAWLQRQES